MMTITVCTFKRLTSMMVVELDGDDDYDDSDGGGGGGEDHSCGRKDFLESHAHPYIIMNSVILMNDFMDYDGDF